MRIVAIIQARMGSVRLPNKVMRKINNVPMIELLLSRISQSKMIDKVVIATTYNSKDRELVKYLHKIGYSCEKGSETDVLSRYIKVAKLHKANVIVRITGDCPLVDSELVDQCIKKYLDSKVDYCSNINPPTYPDGLDVEVFSLNALMKSIETKEKYDREHVTPYIKNSGKFSIYNVYNKENYSMLRWTVDEMDDFEVIKNIYNHFHPRKHFNWGEILELYKKNESLFANNCKIKRNEGELMGRDQKLLKRGKYNKIDYIHNINIL